MAPDPATQLDGRFWQTTVTANGAGAELHLLHPATPVDATFELTSIEGLSLAGSTAADHFVVGDLRGTSLTAVHVDLSIGALSDRVVDEVDVNGTAAGDRVTVQEAALGDLVVSGLQATVTIAHIDASAVRDNVFLLTGAGDDVIDLSRQTVGHGIEVFSGFGNDTILSGNGGAIFNFDNGLRGSDTIVGFHPHAFGGADRVDITSLTDDTPILSLSDLIRHHHIAQSGADVVISDGFGSFLTLTNTQLSSLTSADFIFPF